MAKRSRSHVPRQTPSTKPGASPKGHADAAPDPELQNEGEGSRSAARRYDAGAQRAAQNPKRSDQLAKAAEQAIEGTEGEELRQAEKRGKNAVHR